MYYHNFAPQSSHLINLVYVIVTNQSMKVGNKVMSLFFFLMGCQVVSCLTHRIVKLFCSTRINDVPVSHVNSTQKQRKMADVVDVHTRLRVVTEFPTVESSSLTIIHV